MSTTSQTTVWCDRADCDEFRLVDGGTEIARATARQEAEIKREGAR